MDHVIALPVAGEAFLLRRGRHCVLVDGGWNSRKLASALARHIPSEDLDIVVCTHADGDHAGGLRDLIHYWKVQTSDGLRRGRIGQFWLPGRWIDGLPELLKKPDHVVDGLLRELDEFAAEGEDWVHADDEEAVSHQLVQKVLQERLPESLGEQPRSHPDDPVFSENDFWGEQLSATRYVSVPQIEPMEEPDWMMHLREIACTFSSDRDADIAFASGQRRIRYRNQKGKIGKALATYWLSLIEAAKNIRAIAKEAIAHRIPVRWFDFDEFAQSRQVRGGLRGFLMPLNAVEQSRPLRHSLSYLAKLSPDNEACLAFIAPPGWRSRGVVFCGDSPLGDGPSYGSSFLKHLPAPHGPVVATAPHHGSESNAIAYTHLTRWVRVYGWLRTGGDRRQPGLSFKAIGSSRRVCSHCPQLGLKRQVAGFTLSPIWVIAGHYCCCT